MRSGLYYFNINGLEPCVGWVRRLEGNEYESLNTTTALMRNYAVRNLGSLALKGPPKNWVFDSPVPTSCPFLRNELTGPIVSLQPEQWKEICPKPADWVDEQHPTVACIQCGFDDRVRALETKVSSLDRDVATAGFWINDAAAVLYKLEERLRKIDEVLDTKDSKK